MNHYASKELLRKALIQTVCEKEVAIALAAKYSEEVAILKEALICQSMSCGLLRLQLTVAGHIPYI